MSKEEIVHKKLYNNRLYMGYVYNYACSSEGWVYSMEGCIHYENEAEKQEAVRRAQSYINN